MWSNMLLNNIRIHSLNLLNFVYVHSLNLLNFVYLVVFDVETVLKNAKLAILQRLELQGFFAFSKPRQGCTLCIFPQENFPVFCRNENVIYVRENDWTVKSQAFGWNLMGSNALKM